MKKFYAKMAFEEHTQLSFDVMSEDDIPSGVFDSIRPQLVSRISLGAHSMHGEKIHTHGDVRSFERGLKAEKNPVSKGVHLGFD
jgi:hypothetical protein|tara:strand:+ start:79 stop:330 length:252 start_codon:yes stop_codon:yes gene_type:complete